MCKVVPTVEIEACRPVYAVGVRETRRRRSVVLTLKKEKKERTNELIDEVAQVF